MLKKLSIEETNLRWAEIRGYSTLALNDLMNVTQLGETFEIALARLLLFINQGVAQVWIYEDAGKEKYICMTYIGNALLSGVKHLTIYAVVRIDEDTKEPKKKYWTEALKTICNYAKEAGCKNVNCETDLDYLTEMFKTVSTGQKAIVRNALTLTI